LAVTGFGSRERLAAPVAETRDVTIGRLRSPRPGPGEPLRGHHQHRQGRIADYLTRLDFVILDELGYLPFAQAGGQLLFHLVSRLYERTSIVVTSNQPFGEWGRIFPDSTLS
jgi:IstB-like ATP binding protein